MNNPEYCQNIYEAAKKVVEQYHYEEMKSEADYFLELVDAIRNLERALEGKENV